MYLSTSKKPLCSVLCLILCLAASPLRGQDKTLRSIIDDSTLRTRVKDTWFSEIPAQIMGRAPVMHNLDGGGRVQLRTETGPDEFLVILARELNGTFPGYAQGSWMLIRRKDNGAPTRIRVFLRSDPYMYVQFRPFSADKSLMDIVLYDAYMVRSLPLAVHFERLYTIPVEEALALAGDKFPRRYFEPDPENYRDKRQFITRVRSRLPELTFGDDGAIDETGRYVYINSGAAQIGEQGLNCSGFTKWLIDGMLRPLTGERLAIPPLKAPFGERGSTYTDLWEELRDPFFGLDWIRNLASTASTILRAPSYASLEEIEVREEPFSELIIRSRNGSSTIRSYPGFLENAGYGIEGLTPLLYTLAIDEPGRFYLVAVNNEMGPPTTEANPRGRPRMRQYFHVAALIPYFDEYGVFQVAVFESAEETSLSAFRNRYPGHYISLVRVPLETVFEP